MSDSPAIPGPLARHYLPITLATLALVSIVAFEAMAVTTAMPRVVEELHAVRSYGLAFSAMLTAQLLGIVLAGVWTDRSGPLPGAFTGQALVAVGSAVCGFATHFNLFLLGRVLTGLGGGLLVVMLYVIAGRVYPESIRPRFFTLVAAAWVLPALLGPPLSGWLTRTWSWRLVFWVVVLPTVVTLVVFIRMRSRVDSTAFTDDAVTSRDHTAHVKAAWAGLGIALAAGAVQYGTKDINLALGRDTVIALLGLVGVALTAPRLVPRGTWVMAPGLPSVMFARAIYTAAFYGGITYVPLMLHSEQRWSLTQAGLVIAVGSLGWAVGAWLQGLPQMAIHRVGMVEWGGILLCVGLVLTGLVGWTGWNGWLAAPGLILAGLAMGFGVTSTTVLALELSPLEEHGPVSSSLQLADVLGSVVGIAGANAVFAALHVAAGRDGRLYGLIFSGLAACSLLATVAGRRVGPHERVTG